jgi:hypothetical protein
MEVLRADETVLQGFWLDLGSRMVPDSNWERINHLTTECLELVATGADGSARLYRDPRDGRHWEMTPVSATLPQGPPVLTALDDADARARYPQAFVR